MDDRALLLAGDLVSQPGDAEEAPDRNNLSMYPLEPEDALRAFM